MRFTVGCVITILYPILASTTLAATYTLPFENMTHVRSREAELSYFESPDLHIGYITPECEPFSPWDTTPHICPNFKSRIYLQIPIETLISAEDEENLISVNLVLLAYEYSPSFTYDLYSLAGPWDVEQTTWQTQPPTGPKLSRSTLPLHSAWKEFDLTSWAKEVLDGTITNYGLTIQAASELTTHISFYSPFCSSVSVPSCNSSMKPYLRIVYDQDKSESDIPVNITPTSNSIIHPGTITFRWDDSIFDPSDTTYELVIENPNSTELHYGYISSVQNNYSTVITKEGRYTWQVVRESPLGKFASVRTSFVVDAQNHISFEEDNRKLLFSDEPSDNHRGKNPDKKDSNSDEELEVNTNDAEILGLTLKHKDFSCLIDYYPDERQYSITSCNTGKVPIEIISHTLHTEADFELAFSAEIPESIVVLIKHLQCQKRSLLHPSTWFACKNETIKTTRHRVSVKTWGTTLIDGKLQKEISNRSGNYFSTHLQQNYSGKNFSVSFESRGSIKLDSTWMDIPLTYTSDSVIIPAASRVINKLPFSFPFSSLAGVTQWHGYTAFQSPHTGIDFGANRRAVIAPADGIVESVGWDSYYGQCLSAGNYVKIHHDNGKRTAYFHLEHYKNSAGHTWKPGDTIHRGQQVGLSGNTGAWNCQPLSYHLHYEIRTGSTQSTHTDPVPLTNVDWSAVPTVGWRTNPGRLTGDNPHPIY